MNCDCIHSEVCEKRLRIIESFKNVIEYRFGTPGKQPEWIKVKQLIEELCKYKNK